MRRCQAVWAGLGVALALLVGGASAAPAKTPDASKAPSVAAGKARPPECIPGRPCACSGSDACELTCVPDPKKPSKGCDFSCAGAGSCTFHCPEGGCTSRSSGSGATELTCEGGSCVMTCSGAGTCELNDCRAGCKLSCAGAGVCENECKGAGCSCSGKNCQ
jgi:hypothetical protein